MMRDEYDDYLSDDGDIGFLEDPDENQGTLAQARKTIERTNNPKKTKNKQHRLAGRRDSTLSCMAGWPGNTAIMGMPVIAVTEEDTEIYKKPKIMPLLKEQKEQIKSFFDRVLDIIIPKSNIAYFDTNPDLSKIETHQLSFKEIYSEVIKKAEKTKPQQ